MYAHLTSTVSSRVVSVKTSVYMALNVAMFSMLFSVMYV